MSDLSLIIIFLIISLSVLALLNGFSRRLSPPPVESPPFSPHGEGDFTLSEKVAPLNDHLMTSAITAFIFLSFILLLLPLAIIFHYKVVEGYGLQLLVVMLPLFAFMGLILLFIGKKGK